MQNEVINVVAIFERLKSTLSLRNDSELARALGVAPKKLAVWKTRNTVPYEVLISFCREKGLHLEEVLVGENTKAGRNVHQVATGNGHIQAGGKISIGSGAKVGHVNESTPGYSNGVVKIEKVVRVLEDYVSLKIIEEIKERLVK